MMFYKRKDYLIILLLLVAAGALYFFNQWNAKDKPVVAEIYVESEKIQTIVLDEAADRTFSIQERPAIVFHFYEEGSIAFESSDCPDKVCVRSGKLHLAGQSAACLPNGVIIKIISTDANNKDGMDLVIQ